jgi:lichenan operon transcriptional antiterminator
MFKNMGVVTRIESKTNTGVVLLNNTDIQTIIDSFQESKAGKNQENNTDQKEIQIAFDILFSEYSRIEDLCDKFYYSRGSLSGVIKKIKEKLIQYNIELKTKPHYGMYTNGTEEKIRAFLTGSLLNNTPEERNLILKTFIPLSKIILAKEAIINTLKKYRFPITGNMLEDFMLEVLICMIRIFNSHHYEGTASKQIFTEADRALVFAIAEQLENILSLKINLSEISYISMLLSGKKSYNITMPEYGYPSEKQNIEPVLHKIFSILLEKFHIDFKGDFDLYTSLLLHIIPLLSRIRNHNPASNPTIEEIKTYYPFAYEMAVEAALVIENEFELSLDEREAGYIAIYLQLALERQEQCYIPRRVLVVCPAGQGMSQLLAFKLKKQFERYIFEIKTCDLYSLDLINPSDFDYIFTTVPIEKELPLPVIFLPYSLDEKNIINLKDRFVYNGTEQISIREMMPKPYFLGVIDVSEKKIAIRHVVSLLEEKLQLPADFYEQVMEREEKFPTEIAHLIAFPHPIREGPDKSFLSLAVLKKPIKWEIKPVQIILLGSVKKGDSKKLQLFYRQFAKLVSCKEYAIRIIEKPVFKTLSVIINELEGEM